MKKQSFYISRLKNDAVISTRRLFWGQLLIALMTNSNIETYSLSLSILVAIFSYIRAMNSEVSKSLAKIADDKWSAVVIMNINASRYSSQQTLMYFTNFPVCRIGLENHLTIILQC